MFKKAKDTCAGILAHYHNGDMKKRKGLVIDDFGGGINDTGRVEITEKTFWGEVVVDCAVCKCMLKKKNAYREANMIPSDVYSTMTSIMEGIWGYPMFSAYPKKLSPDKGDTTNYKIEELFYCQKCKPVKKTKKTKKATKKK